ncbi:hypothetical protein ABK040_000767 [Willaertia magna]
MKNVDIAERLMEKEEKKNDELKQEGNEEENNRNCLNEIQNIKFVMLDTLLVFKQLAFTFEYTICRDIVKNNKKPLAFKNIYLLRNYPKELNNAMVDLKNRFANSDIDINTLDMFVNELKLIRVPTTFAPHINERTVYRDEATFRELFSAYCETICPYDTELFSQNVDFMIDYFKEFNNNNFFLRACRAN